MGHRHTHVKTAYRHCAYRCASALHPRVTTLPDVVLAAPDKFRGSLSAVDVARAVSVGAASAGWQTIELPLADGGEGTLEALGGANRESVVTGPLGRPTGARWRLDGTHAVVEMAQASGLALVGGQQGNDPLAATTFGTGQLLAAAIGAGARDIVVAVGGSATTDGGLGAIEALDGIRFSDRAVRVRVACDVRTRFLDAAPVFAPQKGASAQQVEVLRDRLERLAERYRKWFGLDVTPIPGGGAAGGLAGGLAALGAELVPGSELVASATGLTEALAGVDAVITGEGRLDATSFEGKVVGHVSALAAPAGLRVAAVVGSSTVPVTARVDVLSLVALYGEERSFADTAALVAEVTAGWLKELGSAPCRSTARAR
jgi:glycerate kinase